MFGKEAIVVAIKLFVITAVAALCLAFVNKVTAPILTNTFWLVVLRHVKFA